MIKVLVKSAAAAAMLAVCTHSGVVAADSGAKLAAESVARPAACQNFGPQTPRDISSVLGTNPVKFPMPVNSGDMNLCNIHFHNAAEHKGPGFSIKHADVGYECGMAKNLTEAELKPYNGNMCKNVKPGDTIEMHWVHSSCDVSPGPGLGSCLSDTCANPSLRVETQVFTVVNDPNALDFAEFRYAGEGANGMHQPKSLPTGTGTPVEFLGSTTGPSYTEETCSPLQVGWSVRPQCAKVHIGSLSDWCADNAFDEDDAHGVRELVTNPDLLSPIIAATP
ncbi:MAG: delta-class carbonic anhydrase [Pseudomonadota bacterium]